MRNTPIPIADLALSTTHMAKAKYQKDHPLANDTLVDLEALGIDCQPFAEREVIVTRTNPPIKSAHMTQKVWYRATAAQMLVKANELVKKQGYELYVKDAYRPLGVQQEFWDYFISLAKERTRSEDANKLVAYAAQFCSNPTQFDPQKPSTWPLHITGGAVDLTLKNIQTGAELLMEPQGSSYGDISHTHYAEHMLQEASTPEWQEITQNRRVLYHAMLEVGFTNYPHEWWHYDFGTPMYGLIKDPIAPEFFYGYIPNPEA